MYVGWAICAVIAIFAAISLGLAGYYDGQMWMCRTEKADPATWLFVPWWAWLDGMLTEHGIWLRKQYLIASCVGIGLASIDAFILWITGWLHVIATRFSN